MRWPGIFRVYDQSGRAVRVRYRYLALILFAFAFMVLAAVYLPVAMTSTPNFCANCHLMEEPKKLWDESTHSNVNCVMCHVDPGVVNALIHKVESYKEIYANFFGHGEMPPDVKLPSNESCLQCHNLDRNVSPGGDINIPHRQHVEMRDLKCADCHFNVVHTRRAISGGVPPMDICYMCHDGERAPNSCETCHNTPRDEYKRQGHTGEILKNHGKLAKERVEDCRRCHSEESQFCEDCHSQKPQSHQQTDWKYTHRTTVAAEGREPCYGCHEEKFCQKCHKVQHPPHWVQSHPDFAQGGGEPCQVCHSTGFCGDCHTAEGVKVE